VSRAADERRWDSHRHEARAEDARYMLACGETMERVAARLGLTVDGVEKLLDREPDRSTR
jgi:hypothetical protein